MFRDFKEYQDLEKLYKKVYESKEIDKENLEERVRGGGMKTSGVPAPKPVTTPQKGAGGGSGNPTNTRGTGTGAVKFEKPTGAAQGRTKRPQPEIKKFPSTAEIRAQNQGRVGGGNAGASTDSGGTSQSTIKSVEQKPEIKKPDPKPSFKDKFIKKERGKGPGFVRRGTPVAQRAENQEKAKLRAQEMAKARIAAKKEGTASTPMSGKEKAQAMAKARLAKKTAMENYTPYDYVLEYLLSSEQAATIEEANYVMTEMDAETIQGIVEAQKKTLIEFLGGQKGDGYIGHPRLGVENPFSPPKKDKDGKSINTKKTDSSKGLFKSLGNRATDIENKINNP